MVSNLMAEKNCNSYGKSFVCLEFVSSVVCFTPDPLSITSSFVFIDNI